MAILRNCRTKKIMWFIESKLVNVPGNSAILWPFLGVVIFTWPFFHWSDKTWPPSRKNQVGSTAAGSSPGRSLCQGKIPQVHWIHPRRFQGMKKKWCPFGWCEWIGLGKVILRVWMELMLVKYCTSVSCKACIFMFKHPVPSNSRSCLDQNEEQKNTKCSQTHTHSRSPWCFFFTELWTQEKGRMSPTNTNSWWVGLGALVPVNHLPGQIISHKLKAYPRGN